MDNKKAKGLLKGRIIKLADVPMKRRNTNPKGIQALKAIDVWPEAMQLMEADAIGVGEAYTFVVPKAEMDKYGFKTIRPLVRPIKKFLKERYKNKYVLRHRLTDEGPTIMICQLAPGS